MIFEILTDDGSCQFYDNISNQITSPDNLQTNIDQCKSEFAQYSCAKQFTEFSKKSKKVRKLRILVGRQCNYKCSFCIQSSFKIIEPAAKSEDVDRLLASIDSQGIKISSNAKIELQGGEPFVYQKVLQYLIPKLREKQPSSTIQTISNGTIINQRIIDFLIHYRVELIFSHDAQAYFLRGKNPLDDHRIRDLQLTTNDKYRLNELRFGINCVISQFNCDLFKTDEYFVKHLPSVSYGYEGVVVASQPNVVSLCRWSDENIRIFRRCIFESFVNDANERVRGALTWRMVELISRLSHSTSNNYIFARCDAVNDDVLTVDLKGNILACHNVDPAESSYLGKINDFASSCAPSFKHWSERQLCSSCPYLISCKGNCPRNSDAMHNASCIAQRYLHSALFDTAQFMLTGKLITSIKSLSHQSLTLSQRT